MNLVKGYNRTILEDLSPYLTSVVELDRISTKPTYKYTFMTKDKDIDLKTKEVFKYLLRRYGCWTHPAGGIFAWQTKSTVLKELFEQGLVGGSLTSAVIDISESIEDIPNEVLKEFNIENTITGRFTQKEKEMSDKLKVKYSINIAVANKQFTLSDPVHPDDALDAVLALNGRLGNLNAQKETLQELEDTENVARVLDAEIDEIKETIEYINDNIKD